MASLRNYKPLRLMAADTEDLGVVSACLQDSVAKVGDFTFQADARRFAFVCNRFVWECAQGRAAGPFARVRTGCRFDDVISVQQSNIRTDAKSAIVSLLAIKFEPDADGAGVIDLQFAGGGAMRLRVESVNVQLDDLSAPWRTGSEPKHDD